MQIELSIILPVFNKKNSIEHVITQIETIIAKSPRIASYEIICIDDCSTDESLAVLKKLSSKHLVLIELIKNQGQLRAVEIGLKQANGEITAIYSCDLQNPFQTIPVLFDAIKKGHNAAIGFRSKRSDSGFDVIMSKVFFKIVSLFERKMPAGGFDFVLLDQEVKTQLLTKDFSKIFLQIEILRSSRNTYFLPTERINDNFDKSSWTLKAKLNYALKAFKYLIK